MVDIMIMMLVNRSNPDGVWPRWIRIISRIPDPSIAYPMVVTSNPDSVG